MTRPGLTQLGAPAGTVAFERHWYRRKQEIYARGAVAQSVDYFLFRSLVLATAKFFSLTVDGTACVSHPVQGFPQYLSSERGFVNAKQFVLTLPDEAYEKKTWHGPNLRQSLKGVTAQQAAWRPGRGNTTFGKKPRTLRTGNMQCADASKAASVVLLS